MSKNRIPVPLWSPSAHAHTGRIRKRLNSLLKYAYKRVESATVTPEPRPARRLLIVELYRRLFVSPPKRRQRP